MICMKPCCVRTYQLFWKCWTVGVPNSILSKDVTRSTAASTLQLLHINLWNISLTSVQVPKRIIANTCTINFQRQEKITLESLFTTDHSFDVELISRIIDQLQRGKAAGLDNITAEHLQYSHPVLSSVLTKLFNLMLDCAYTVIFWL